jgi:hypothetical protein
VDQGHFAFFSRNPWSTRHNLKSLARLRANFRQSPIAQVEVEARCPYASSMRDWLGVARIARTPSCPHRNRKFAYPLLKGTGFELPVPHENGYHFKPSHVVYMAETVCVVPKGIGVDES